MGSPFPCWEYLGMEHPSHFYRIRLTINQLQPVFLFHLQILQSPSVKLTEIWNNDRKQNISERASHGFPRFPIFTGKLNGFLTIHELGVANHNITKWAFLHTTHHILRPDSQTWLAGKS